MRGIDIQRGQFPEATEENVTKAEHESEARFKELQEIEAFQRLVSHPDWQTFVRMVAGEIKLLNLSLQNIDPFEKPKEILRVQARIKALGMLVEEPTRRASQGLWRKVNQELDETKAKAKRLLAKLTTS